MKILSNPIRRLFVVCGVLFSLTQLVGCGQSDGNTTVFDNASEEQIQAAMERGVSDEEEANLAKVKEQIEE